MYIYIHIYINIIYYICRPTSGMRGVRFFNTVCLCRILHQDSLRQRQISKGLLLPPSAPWTSKLESVKHKLGAQLVMPECLETKQVYLFIYLSIYLSIYLPTYLSISLYMYIIIQQQKKQKGENCITHIQRIEHMPVGPSTKPEFTSHKHKIACPSLHYCALSATRNHETNRDNSRILAITGEVSRNLETSRECSRNLQKSREISWTL